MPTETTAPVFTRQLENRDVFETTSVRLECDVIGYPQPEITWYQVNKRNSGSMANETIFLRNTYELLHLFHQKSQVFSRKLDDLVIATVVGLTSDVYRSVT